MIETALAQLRFAYSMLTGQPFSLWSLERIIDALRDTRREFGEIGSEGAEMVQGPALDDETRRELQTRRFRQAARLARDTAYYGGLFARLALDPQSPISNLQLPITTKESVRDNPDAFVRRGSRPYLRATTTGTTSAPTSICFSLHEMRVYAALEAIDLLFKGSIQTDDIVQISTASRGLLGNVCLAGALAHVGALVTMAGIVDPAYALAQLAEERRIPGKKPHVSVLYTYPSYLGELIETGLRLGYRPADFGLEHIAVGGEIVTAGVMARARKLFGEVRFTQGYGMTEIWPLGGALCEEGHLHFEPSHGLVEIINPETGQPVQPGDIGSIVATPFPPFRETTIVLRYDTQDMVRVLDSRPDRSFRDLSGLGLTCSRKRQPAVSPLLGKLKHAVRHDDGWTFSRDVLEAVADVPLPARCGWWAVEGGVAVEVVVRRNTAATRQAIGRSFESHGVPVRELHLHERASQLRHPFPWRSDQRETTLDSAATNGANFHELIHPAIRAHSREAIRG